MGTTPNICIIGAGLSGLCAAIKLKTELSLKTFTIFDSCADVGGTWLVNNYPGCACDVPSHFYSFSFAPKYDWSQFHAPQSEILDYIKDVTRQHEIYQHIQFESRVESLRWNQERMKWTTSILDLKNKTLETLDFDLVINASGKLRIPHCPEEYLDFKGTLIHSAEWDHSVDLKGKRVGVVGTGSSSVQIVAEIADKVETLTVFQRTPSHIIPRVQFHYSKLSQWAFANVPLLYRASRAALFWCYEVLYVGTRHNHWMNKFGVKLTEWYRNIQIKDPKLREELTPEYAFACKRVVSSDKYYHVLASPNVTLVTSRISNVFEKEIELENGSQIELDILILATGYKRQDFFSPMKIYGLDGMNILEEWRKYRPKGHLGICSHDMPNLFTLLGPYTFIGHSSNIFNIECQVYWTILAIKKLLEKRARCMTLTKEAEEQFMNFIDEQFKPTVWANEYCGSWYLNSQRVNSTLWPLNQVEFWRHCSRLGEDLFHFT